MRTADFDFALPDAQIAQYPARPRDFARMLVVGDTLRDATVRDLPSLLRPGDLMVVNDTRVIPARLVAHRGTARIEVMLNRAEGAGVWHALLRNARRLRAGDTLSFEGSEVTAQVLEAPADGAARLDFGTASLTGMGEVPLPPYIARPDGPTVADATDYQTAFAEKPGAVAAPTASLHFTPELLAALDERGVARVALTLHVGAGTFLPLRAENPRDHRLHAEWGEITPEAAAAINAAPRVIAIGTTALRLMEAAATPGARVRPFQGLTDIYLLPGHRFTTADMLMTNFHLPKSTLLMLVSAFAGTARMRAAYAHAVAGGYRFYSYGDSSLLELARDLEDGAA